MYFAVCFLEPTEVVRALIGKQSQIFTFIYEINIKSIITRTTFYRRLYCTPSTDFSLIK